MSIRSKGRSTRADKRPGAVPTRERRGEAGPFASGAADSSVRNAVAWTMLAYLGARILFLALDTQGGRFWGLNFAWYLHGDADIWIAMLLPFLAFASAPNRLFSRLIEERPGRMPSTRYALIATAAVAVAAAVALNVRTEFSFLGDGTLYETEIRRISREGSAYATSLIKPTSFLTGHVLRSLALAFQGADIRMPYIAAGTAGIAVVVISLFAGLRGEQRAASFLLAGAALFASGSLLFFGYVELYALQYAFAISFFIAAFACLRGRSGLAWPVSAWLLSVAFGISSVIFAPALLLLILSRARSEAFPRLGPRFVTAVAVLFPIASVLAYVLSAPVSFDGYLAPPARIEQLHGGLHGDWSSYTLFAPERIVDIANVLLLNGGILAVMLPVLAIASRSRRQWLADPLVCFFVTAALGGLGSLLIANATMGYSRDWDFATIPVLGIAFLGAVLLLSLHERGLLRLRDVLLPLLLILFTNAYAWVRVNAGPESASRFEALLALDSGDVSGFITYNGLENLRKYIVRSYYTLPEAPRRHNTVLKHMLATGYRKPDTYAKLVGACAATASLDDGADLRWAYTQLLADARRESAAREYAAIGDAELRELAARLLLIGIQAGRGDVSRSVFTQFTRALPAWKEGGFVEAYLIPGLTPDQQADRAAAGVDTTNSDASLLIAAANVLENAGRAGDAALRYERALQAHPRDYTDVYLTLASLYTERLGDSSRAIGALRRCIANAPGSADAAEAERRLRLLPPSNP